MLPLEPHSHPKLQTLYRLNLPVIGTVKIRLRGSDMGMTHERLNGLEIIPLIQERRCERVSHYVRMDPFLDHGPFYHRSDKAVNRFFGQIFWSDPFPGMARASQESKTGNEPDRFHCR
jgi:hypothetical protein